MKTVKTAVALTLASGGIGLPDTTFSEVHEAITHVLGWDVFTHELAESFPWRQAAANIHAHSETLKRYGVELEENRENFADILARCIAEIGSDVELPHGDGERTEHPLASLQRIAPDKPVIVVTQEEGAA